VPIATNEEIRVRIRSLIAELAPNPKNDLESGALLVEDLEYHSLALLELAFALEDEFDLPPIDQANVVDIRAVKDVEDYVLRQLSDPARR
jgi:acyl carrier protein